MEYFKHYESYNHANLEVEFIKWVSDKLSINITEDDFLGSGVEGEVYAIDKFRVIKICNYNLDMYLHLVNKNIKGLVKIYHVGQLVVPKRFKGYTDEQQTEYQGIHLLNPNRTDGRKDYTLNYVIMERLYPSDELSERILKVDQNIWIQYVTGQNEPEPQSIQREKRNNPEKIGKSSALNKVLHRTYTGFYHFFLKTIAEVYSLELYTDFTAFVQEHHPAYSELVNQLFDISKALHDHNIKWSDSHGGNYAYNSKGEVVAFDISHDDSFGNQPKNTIKENKGE
jgi:hypothetical protein